MAESNVLDGRLSARRPHSIYSPPNQLIFTGMYSGKGDFFWSSNDGEWTERWRVDGTVFRTKSRCLCCSGSGRTAFSPPHPFRYVSVKSKELWHRTSVPQSYGCCKTHQKLSWLRNRSLNFSDLKAFRRRTEELKNEAAGTEVVENLEDVEETAQSPDPASFQCGCRWGSIVKKYNAMTTNHYINWPKPLNFTADVPNMVRQSALRRARRSWIQAESVTQPSRRMEYQRGSLNFTATRRSSAIRAAIRKKMQALVGQGIAEAVQASSFPPLIEYEENEGPVCSLCELRVYKLVKSNPATCKLCKKRYHDIPGGYRKQFGQLPASESRAGQKRENACLPVRTKVESVEQVGYRSFSKVVYSCTTQQNVSVSFGIAKKNLPPACEDRLYPIPLSAMSEPFKEQAADVMTLNMLPTFIINDYRPGDTVLIAMNQPVSLCIGHQDLVLVASGCLYSCRVVALESTLTNAVVLVVVRCTTMLWLQKAFITELFERGIPRDSLFFHCHGLQTEHSKTVNYATNVLAADLLDGLVNKMPRFKNEIDTTAHTCVTPTLLSPRRVVPMLWSDTEEEEENVEEKDEEKVEENYAKNDEENKEEVMAEQVSQLSVMSMFESGRKDDGGDELVTAQSVEKVWLEEEADPPLEQRPAKRRRLLSSFSSSLEIAPISSLLNLSPTVSFRNRHSLGVRRK
ncbi:hypothetical protein DAPPUDRAFT_116798 [Daphnia pulex]|uniref:Uncharacterized protein n=1 Tax=Daphnia pulex TaxID=6669 RepID=E9HQJ4_DAPPU|nr:hypothetical protein DAPPUDRAFT_116798 [Daphnia pulex]|eukprot:EFX65990.1 hypothetical protein DAPPUDRAFT_116798 [Daphnia pulex]